MTLREARVQFTLLLPWLILQAEDLGLEPAADYVKRCEDCRVGAVKSNHKKALAIDLHLYKSGEYQATTETHKPLGEFWESLHPWCRWGGRFNDGNHYEFIIGGWR